MSKYFPKLSLKRSAKGPAVVRDTSWFSDRMAVQLYHRCHQTIGEIVADVQALGANVVDTGEDGPLVHLRRGGSVLGVAHMDYVNVPNRWKYKKRKGTVTTPRLDDRLGVWVLLDYLPTIGIELDLLLCDSEEVGASTARHHAETSAKEAGYNWLVEFDRRGDDVVLYDYEDDETWLSAVKAGGFDVGQGSFSDISCLCGLGVCGFNVGVGYHNEHSSHCHCDLVQLKGNLDLFARFYESSKGVKFGYTERERVAWWKTDKWAGYGGGSSYSAGKSSGAWSAKFGSGAGYGPAGRGIRYECRLCGESVASWNAQFGCADCEYYCGDEFAELSESAYLDYLDEKDAAKRAELERLAERRRDIANSLRSGAPLSGWRDDELESSPMSKDDDDDGFGADGGEGVPF
jgi:hypothetical protein